jgi:hypothetical protein
MSRYAVLATILCLTSISTAQDKKAEDVAKKNTAPDGYIESLPGGIPTDAQEPEDRTAKTAGFGWYNNCGVNIPTTLNGTNGTTKISVYARDVSWWFARGGRKIRNVQGDGGAGGDFPMRINSASLSTKEIAIGMSIRQVRVAPL